MVYPYQVEAPHSLLHRSCNLRVPSLHHFIFLQAHGLELTACSNLQQQTAPSQLLHVDLDGPPDRPSLFFGIDCLCSYRFSSSLLSPLFFHYPYLGPRPFVSHLVHPKFCLLFLFLSLCITLLTTPSLLSIPSNKIEAKAPLALCVFAPGTSFVLRLRNTSSSTPTRAASPGFALSHAWSVSCASANPQTRPCSHQTKLSCLRGFWLLEPRS